MPHKLLRRIIGSGRRSRPVTAAGYGFLRSPEALEARIVYRIPNDPFMRPPVRVGDPPNPQWNMERIEALRAWDFFGGNRVNVVAVMDYGIDYTHEDFGSSLSGSPGNLWDRGRVFANYAKRGFDEINAAILPTNQPDGATKPATTDFLGNHAAGIIGALTGNQVGVSGINWSTQLYSSKILDGAKTPSMGVIRSAIDRIIQMRSSPQSEQLVRAVAFGWSTTTPFGNPMPEFRRLVQAPLAAPDKGVLVTVPAGDTGPLSLNYPAVFKTPADENVLVVGATDQNDAVWAGNSNRTVIDIYAPGVNIVSIGAAGNSYQTVTGTRQAAAHVAGAISLIYDAARVNNQTLNWRDVKAAIINGADLVNGVRRLNIVGALQQLNLFRRPAGTGPALTLTGGAGAEGNSGTTLATFGLAMDRTYASPVSFKVKISDGTARLVDNDYVAASPDGTLVVTIPANQRNVSFTVRVNGDLRIEQDETITATLIDVPPEANVVVGTATWTIQNDDSVPDMSLAGPFTFTEGNSGVRLARVAVKLSRPSPMVVTAKYAVTAGTATAGTDFVVPPANATVTFAPNQTTQWISLSLLGDRVTEPDETFTLTLSNPLNATTGAAATAIVTIVDDEVPLVAVQAVRAAALANARNRMVFTVSLSGPAAGPVTMNVAAVDGTAVNGTDFSLAPATLTFAAGERTKTIVVTILPRRAGQPYPRTFSLRLSGLTGGKFQGDAVDATVLGTIV